MTEARIVSFKENMQLSNIFLKEMCQKLQNGLNDALSHYKGRGLLRDDDHPAKLAYFALTKKLDDHFIQVEQRKLKTTDIDWHLKTCVIAYSQKQNELLNKPTVFDFNHYYDGLSDNKKKFIETLISFYQALIAFYEHCLWDFKYEVASSAASEYDAHVQQLTETFKKMHRGRMIPRIDETIFDASLIESNKESIDLLWKPYLIEGMHILTAWLAKEREVHSYVMSVSELINLKTQDLKEYCNALDALEIEVQYEVDKCQQLKDTWIKQLDLLIDKIKTTSYIVTDLPQEKWQHYQRNLPGMMAMSKEQDHFQQLEQDACLDKSCYDLVCATYSDLLNQNKNIYLDKWVAKYRELLYGLVASINQMQSVCHLQTTTNNERWRGNLDSIFATLLTWTESKKNVDMQMLLRQKLAEDINYYCVHIAETVLKDNQEKLKEQMDAGYKALQVMKEALIKENQLYYQEANQFYQKNLNHYMKERQSDVLNVIVDTKKQLLSKSIPSIKKIFADAKEEYSKYWKQKSNDSYFAMTFNIVYQAGTYAVMPVVATARLIAMPVRYTTHFFSQRQATPTLQASSSLSATNSMSP